MKNIEGLTKWGAVAYYCGIMRKGNGSHWHFMRLHPFTIVIFGYGLIATLFVDGLSSFPESWKFIKDNTVWW